MVPALLIFSFLLVHLHDEVGRGDEAVSYLPDKVILGTVAAVAVVWAVTHAAVIVAGRLVDRGRVHWARRCDTMIGASRLLVAGIVAVSIFAFGYLDAVRVYVGEGVLLDRLLGVLPLWGFIAAGWVSQYEIDRRIREAMFYRSIQSGRPIEPIETRAKHVWLQIRHQLLMWVLPLCMISSVGQFVQNYIGARPAVAAMLGPVGLNLVQLGASLAMFVFTPVVVRRVWRTTELGEGELRERIVSICRTHGVRVRGPYVWRTGSSVLNAAVLGLLFPARYLVYTDALLETLTPRQLDAVTAHEVAHLRLWHMLWLGVTAFAAIWVASAAVAMGFTFGIAALERLVYVDINSVAVQGAMALLVFGSAGWFFCYASRRFEWQADAFAVKHLSVHRADGRGSEVVTPEAAAAVADALIAVAYYNGIPEEKFQWRHGSIGERRRRVLGLVGQPVNGLPIDRASAVIRWTSLAALVGVGVLSAYVG